MDFAVSFSDEHDSSRFDLWERSFDLTLLGQVDRMTGGVRSTLHEFVFSDVRITHRDGVPTHGNIFMSLSHALEDRARGPWGARVVMFNEDGSLVPVGRALLSIR